LSRKPRVQSKRPRCTKLAGAEECGDNDALKMGRMWNEVRGLLTAANLLLLAFMLVSQMASAAFDIAGREPPPGFDLLQTFGAVYAAGYWIQVDNRRYNFKWPYCQGIFLYVVGWFVIPYYLFKTRGAYGFLTLFIFLCLTILFTFIGMFAGTLLFGSRFN
jgi:uncharacterized membrane protein YhdT